MKSNILKKVQPAIPYFTKTTKVGSVIVAIIVNAPNKSTADSIHSFLVKSAETLSVPIVPIKEINKILSELFWSGLVINYIDNETSKNPIVYWEIGGQQHLKHLLQ